MLYAINYSRYKDIVENKSHRCCLQEAYSFSLEAGKKVIKQVNIKDEARAVKEQIKTLQ